MSTKEEPKALTKLELAKSIAAIGIPKKIETKYPIGFTHICVTCKTMFQGDKRVVQCEPCAIEMTKEEQKQHLIDIMNRETLEEAAKELYPIEYTGRMFMPNRDEVNNSYKQEGFIDGYNKAKEDYEVVSSVREVHQYKLGLEDGYKKAKERMYSEEQVIELIQFLSMDKDFNGYGSVSKETAKYFLEKFKNR